MLHGVPLATFDLDLVPEGSAANLDRLHSCLVSMNAFYRGRGDERLPPERSHLDHRGHILLVTDFGPLDVLGYIGKNWTYERLFDRTEIVDCDGMKLRILDLETIVQIKKELPREKDQASLPLLESALERKRQNGKP